MCVRGKLCEYEEGCVQVRKAVLVQGKLLV